MKPSILLENYRHGYDLLLLNVIGLLESDPRVTAAWLFGSLGRGDGDALSDIDVWAAVQDDTLEQVVAMRRQYTSRVGTPIMFFESPERAPENGGYLTVFYDGPIAPHKVDWYWQPQSQAVLPPEARLLFDRAGLPHGTQPVNFPWLSPVDEIVRQPAHFVVSFWVALFATAKYVARSESQLDQTLFPFFLGTLYQTYQYLNIPCHSISGEDYSRVASAVERLQILRQFGDEMQTMMQQLEPMEEDEPGKFVKGIYRFLDLVETILER